MVHGITYSDETMTISRDKCMDSMKRHGVNVVHGYNETWWKAWEHTDTFDWLNKDTLAAERGAGYWLWKPWCIAHAMNDMADGDILIYSDAGVEFINSAHHIIDRMDEDIFFFTNGWPHVEWCKMDVLTTILGEDQYYIQASISNEKQVQASVIFFRVNQKTRDFVKEWLLYCQMPGFIDDSPSKLPNYPTFAEHRHDQAILTCLQIKYGYKLHWWPTQYSEHIRVPGDTYPVIFNHHRKRNNEY